MNRIQFFILTGLSSLIALLLIGHIFLVRQSNYEQALFGQAQQIVNQGQASQAMIKQLALRIFQDSQKTQDQGLKDLLTRQQITYTPSPDSTNSTDSPVLPTPSPTH
jgi:hypothetical protein